jgi:hypothetical protein
MAKELKIKFKDKEGNQLEIREEYELTPKEIEEYYQQLYQGLLKYSGTKRGAQTDLARAKRDQMHKSCTVEEALDYLTM